ncbi:MAG: hypothetical protein ACLTZM_02495 [Ruminococcus sp.]
MKKSNVDIACQKALVWSSSRTSCLDSSSWATKEMQLHLGKIDLVQLMEQMLDEMTPSLKK